VQFGSTVTIVRDDGRRQTFRIVGEDEAEPAQGTLSYVSPVARALLNKAVGDVITAGSGEAESSRIRDDRAAFAFHIVVTRCPCAAALLFGRPRV
jgi:transcription elongation GreA/GreB family factor